MLSCCCWLPQTEWKTGHWKLKKWKTDDLHCTEQVWKYVRLQSALNAQKVKKLPKLGRAAQLPYCWCAVIAAITGCSLDTFYQCYLLPWPFVLLTYRSGIHHSHHRLLLHQVSGFTIQMFVHNRRWDKMFFSKWYLSKFRTGTSFFYHTIATILQEVVQKLFNEDEENLEKESISQTELSSDPKTVCHLTGLLHRIFVNERKCY